MDPALRLDLTSSGADLADAYEHARRAYGEYGYPCLEVTLGPAGIEVQDLWYPAITELWFERRRRLIGEMNAAFVDLWWHVEVCGEVGTEKGVWMLDREGGLIYRRIHPVVMTEDGRACN